MDSTGRCFILENGIYTKITYGELMERSRTDLADRLFLPHHGMLMEVSADEYKRFYKEQRRQKYLQEESERNEEISYHMLTTDEFNGEDILVSPDPSVEDQAIRRIMLDKLCGCLMQLKDDEIKLIRALYFRCISEREYSAETGLPQKTINNRKRSLLARLRKILEE